MMTRPLSKMAIQKWRGRVLFCILLLVFGLLFSYQKQLPDSYVGKDVSQILAAIPKGDRERLDFFFHDAIGWDAFGYVLLGEKPMALYVVPEAISPFSSLDAFRHFIIPRRMKSVRGFETWKKYEKFFPTSRFILLYERDALNNLLVLLINKNAFIRKVEQHLEDFQTILHRDIKGEEILVEAQSRPLLTHVLMNHQLLIGILLGYGRENACMFHQKCQLTTEEEKRDFFEKTGLNSAWTAEEFEEFRKQFDSIGWIDTYITGAHIKDLNLMTLPGFAAILNSAETEELRNQYLETKKAIIEFYKDKDFLETTLKLLTS